MTEELLLIHYGSKKFDRELFEPIRNGDLNKSEEESTITNRWHISKPNGGLWACPINSELSWRQFVDENYGEIHEKDDYFVFKLKPEAKVLKIDSMEARDKLETLPDVFELSLQELDKKFFNDNLNPRKYRLDEKINFEKLVEQGWDALWVTAEIISKDIMTLPQKFLVWDVETVLILNPDCIEQTEQISL